MNRALTDKIDDEALKRTPFLVERLQAVTVGQQRTDGLCDSLPSHSPLPFIKEAVGHEIRATLHFYVLKVQMQRANMGKYI